MKKRQFLAPLALSLATLLNAAAADASASQNDLGQSILASTQTAGGSVVLPSDFVLQPARNAARAEQFAGHYSHSSHASHASHASHYSSRY